MPLRGTHPEHTHMGLGHVSTTHESELGGELGPGGAVYNLLLESGDNLLLEDGSVILLE